MTYFVTPEFHRQIWTKCPPFKMVAAPLLLLVMWGIATGDLGIGLRMNDALKIGIFYLFVLVVMVWGSYEASTAMDEEIRSRTWDYQKVSAISPLQLVFGKIFGSTAYVWYVGLMCMAVYRTTFDVPLRPEIYAMFYMLAAGVAGHLVAFLFSMSSFAARARHGAVKGGGAGIFPCIAGIIVSFYMTRAYAMNALQTGIPYSYLKWYNEYFDGLESTACGLTFFIFWAAVGCYRMVRAELMYRMWPWVWMVFVPSVTIAISGIFARSPAYLLGEFKPVNLIPPALCAFCVCFTLGYATLLAESSDRRKYERLGASLRARAWGRAFENTPLWITTLPYVAFTGALLVGLCLMSQQFASAQFGPAAVAALLFAARDGFAVHTLHNTLRKRAAFAVPLYFVLVYAVLPVIFLAASGTTLQLRRSVFSYLELPQVQEIFYPHRADEWMATLAMPLLQAVLACFVFLRFALKTDATNRNAVS